MRAGIYARISSDKDHEALGVERQLQDCRALCAKRGWTVAPDAEYVDNDISAAKPGKKRPEHERLMGDIRAGKLDAVVVWDEDRLYRQPRELEPFVDACEVVGLRTLASVGGDMDLNDENALFMLRMKVNVAAMEVAKIRKRVRRQKQERAEKGLNHGGKRAFGFEKDGVTIRENEAVLIRAACNRILEGGSVTGICRDWNKMGVSTVMGTGGWTLTRMRQMLLSPRLAGIRQYHGEEVGKAVWDPILQEDDWRRMYAILKDPSRQAPNVGGVEGRVYMLRGVLRCGECGTTLTAMHRGGQSDRIYGCRKVVGRKGCGHVYIRANTIEAWVRERLVPWADDPRMRDALSAVAGAQAEEIRALVLENAGDEARLSEAASAYASGDISLATLGKVTRPLEKAIGERLAKIAAMRGQSTLDRFGGSVAEKWEAMTPEDKRSVLLALVEHIRVDRANGRSPLAVAMRFKVQWRDGIAILENAIYTDWGEIWQYEPEVDEESAAMAERWAKAQVGRS
jgi:DNA invertase Pin-like site-specific DNA recombinase